MKLLSEETTATLNMLFILSLPFLYIFEIVEFEVVVVIFLFFIAMDVWVLRNYVRERE